MDTTGSLLGALALSGLLGSLGHCLGMCGPMVLMMGTRVKARGLSQLPTHLLYHGMRIAVYTVLGAVTGGIGSLLGVGAPLSRIAGMVSLLLGLTVLGVGFGYLGWLPIKPLAGATAWWARLAARAFAPGGQRRVALLGALNGILPCGLVYSALLVAANTGSALQGALGMALFGAGTLPTLVIVGLGSGILNSRARRVLQRFSGLFIVLVGAQLILRGLAVTHVVPHLRLGELVIW